MMNITPEHANDFIAPMFEGLIGMRFDETSADRVRASLDISASLHQPTGVIHGGVYCAMVESVASWGATIWLDGKGHALGTCNTTDFLRAATGTKLVAEATPIMRGRRQQLWRVVVADDTGRECAIGQLRLQNVWHEPQ
jgi:1,4-dihydroxy-2-naphthoyl-CoA hydrolase